MKLKSNMDMFARRGDTWNVTRQPGYFKPERLEHVKPGKGEWSTRLTKPGIYKWASEIEPLFQPSELGIEVDAARCVRRRPSRHERKAGIIGKGFLPDKKMVIDNNDLRRKITNFLMSSPTLKRKV